MRATLETAELTVFTTVVRLGSFTSLARDGHGIALLPWCRVAADVAEGRLAPVLPGWSRAPLPVHALLASSRCMTAEVRRFVDPCVETFESVHREIDPPSPGAADRTAVGSARGGARRSRPRSPSRSA